MRVFEVVTTRADGAGTRALYSSRRKVVDRIRACAPPELSAAVARLEPEGAVWFGAVEDGAPIRVRVECREVL